MTPGEMLRAARSLRRVSQRELAAHAGIPRTTVDRIDADRTSPRLDTMATLLKAVGCELVVRTTLGRRVPSVDEQRPRFRDAGGRHLPAHLPIAVPKYMGDGPNWWGWHHIAWPGLEERVPEHMYWHPRRSTQPRLGDPVESSLGYVWDDAT